MAEPWVLGLSMGFHNGAACICHGSEIVAAIQEERLTRVKRDRIKDPATSKAIAYCLDVANKHVRDLDLIVGCTIDMSETRVQELVRASWSDEARLPPVVCVPHHLGHALSVFCTSGYPEATVLIVDGGGSRGAHLPADERKVSINFSDSHFEHISVYHTDGTTIAPVEKHMADLIYLAGGGLYPTRMTPFRSLGHMFSSCAHQIFGDYHEAGKVMALAPLGEANIPWSEFFEWDGTTILFKDNVPNRFDHVERWPRRREAYQDLAASMQRALEHALSCLVTKIDAHAASRNLCYAGGVALNSVANAKLLQGTRFEQLAILPAAEDNGTAIGAAFHGLQQLTGCLRRRRQRSDFMGRTYCDQAVASAIDSVPGLMVISRRDPVEHCVELLCEQKIVGWFQGGSEFGPRALGHRSILADPRHPNTKAVLNARVKRREEFRPFAPAILADHVTEWFDVPEPTPLMEHMLEVCSFKAQLRSDVPAVIHVDRSGRLQVVRDDIDPLFYRLIRTFHERTGVPILLNTSMNLMGEPIVETPLDALLFLLFADIDCCIVHDRVVAKMQDPESLLDAAPVLTTSGHRALDGQLNDVGQFMTPYYRRGVDDLRAALQRVDGHSSLRSIVGHLMEADENARGLMIMRRLLRHSLVKLTPP